MGYDDWQFQIDQIKNKSGKLTKIEQNFVKVNQEAKDYFKKGQNVNRDTEREFIEWANKTNTPYFFDKTGNLDKAFPTKAGQDKYVEIYQNQKDKTYGKDGWGLQTLEYDRKLLDAKTLLYQERGEKQKADYLKQMRGQVQYGIADQLKKVKPEDTQKQDPKKVNTVSFNPNITINVATKDGEVGETIKAQLNDQLYSIFNETIRSLDT
jgi:hypothetical protein